MPQEGYDYNPDTCPYNLEMIKRIWKIEKNIVSL